MKKMPRIYKTFYVHNTTAHGITNAHKTKIRNYKTNILFAFKLLGVTFIMLINVKMQQLLAL